MSNLEDTHEEKIPDNILARVRKLVERAEHPGTNPNEADACRQKADALMFQWSIDAAMLRNVAPASLRAKPMKIPLIVHGPGNPVGGIICLLAKAVADFCRCQIVYIGMAPHGVVAHWDVRARVYGMEPDVRYFEILYTQLALHLANSLAPKPDSALSKQENIHRLHVEYGMNWLDIARLYGWNGDQSTASLYGSRIKAEYKKYITDNNLPYVKTGNRIVWMKNFARAYYTRVAIRLAEIAARRPVETALVLRGSEADVRAMFEEENPDIGTVGVDDGSPVFHEGAYRAGDAAGNRADLMTPAATGRSSARPIGGAE